MSTPLLEKTETVQVWIIDWQLLPGIVGTGAEATGEGAKEFFKVEEKGSEEDTGEEERENDASD